MDKMKQLTNMHAIWDFLKKDGTRAQRMFNGMILERWTGNVKWDKSNNKKILYGEGKLTNSWGNGTLEFVDLDGDYLEAEIYQELLNSFGIDLLKEFMQKEQ